MSWNPPSPSDVVHQGEQIVNNVVDTTEQSAENVANDADNTANNAATAAGNAAAAGEAAMECVIAAAGAALTASNAANMALMRDGLNELKNTKGALANEVADVEKNVVTEAKKSADNLWHGITAVAISTLAASLALQIAMGRLATSTAIDCVRVAISILRYMVAAEKQKALNEVGRLGAELGRLNSALARLMQELTRIQSSERTQEGRAQNSGSRDQVLLNLQKTADQMASLRQAVVALVKPAPPEKHYEAAAAQLRRLQIAIGRMLPSVQRRIGFKPRLAAAASAMRRIQDHCQNTSAKLVDAKTAALRTHVQKAVNVTPGFKKPLSGAF